MASTTVSNRKTTWDSNANSDYAVLVDQVGSEIVPYVKLNYGDAGDSSPVTQANPLPVIAIPSTLGVVTPAQTTVGVTALSSLISTNSLATKSTYLINISNVTIYVSWNNPATVSDIPVLPGGTFQLSAYFGGPIFDADLYGIHGSIGTKNIVLVKANFS